jgi:FKBP-type peptidyl-prolyl cis-trans isomerase
MRRINFLLFTVIAAAIFTGCAKAKYRKTAGGMPYQLFSSGDTQKVKAGNVIKVSFTRKIKDSLAYTTEGGMPAYIPITTYSEPYDISEIWTKLKLGDSVVTVQMMDTFIKRSPMGVPPNFKKGDRVVTTVKILQIFESDSLAKIDEKKYTDSMMAKEITFLEKYLAGKNITAQKTVSGAWVEIINPGTGNLIDSGKFVSVNYTGTSFSGKKFDSNTDSAFGHVQPLQFIVGSGQMIKGFDEGVRFMKLGGRARVYVPSMLGYGGNPDPRSGIKPYEHLIFDLTVTDVKDKAPTRSEMDQMDKKVDVPQHK